MPDSENFRQAVSLFIISSPVIKLTDGEGIINGRKRFLSDYSVALIKTEIMNKTVPVSPALFNLNPTLKINLAVEKSFHTTAVSGVAGQPYPVC